VPVSPNQPPDWRSDPDRPRLHHYRFAHRVLPSIVRNPRIDLRRMDIEAVNHALLSTWQGYGEELDAGERLQAAGLRAEVVPLGAHTVVLVTMPPAERMTEAHFVAVSYPGGEAPPRYLVLEDSRALDGGRCTVLGEWTDEGHLNLGGGPAPTKDAFLAAVSRLLG
jgi:hypothetical protein